MEHPGVVCHAQGIPLGINAPITLLVLLPQVVFGTCGSLIIGCKLTHAGTAADIASNDRYGSLINKKATFNRGEFAADGAIKDLGNPRV